MEQQQFESIMSKLNEILEKVDAGGFRVLRTQKQESGTTVPDEAFDTFWKAYPRKVGKGAARRAWKKIKKPDVILALILEALAWQKKSADWTKDGGEFVPYPSKYLNDMRWCDEYPE